jgi:hypothetical protein
MKEHFFGGFPTILLERKIPPRKELYKCISPKWLNFLLKINSKKNSDTL